MQQKVKMLTVENLIEIFGSRSLAYRLLNRQDFPTVRIGKKLFVNEDSLVQWIKRMENQSM